MNGEAFDLMWPWCLPESLVFADVRDVGLDVVLVSSRYIFLRGLFSVVGFGLGNVILVSSRDPGVTHVFSAGGLGLGSVGPRASGISSRGVVALWRCRKSCARMCFATDESFEKFVY